MDIRLKDGMLVIIPRCETEAEKLQSWKVDHANKVFWLRPDDGTGVALGVVGLREVACNVPINITSAIRDPKLRLISNFATTPFEMDGQRYQSVESFWQGLKFEDQERREEIAMMDGPAARVAGFDAVYGATVTYQGESLSVGTWDHWRLMKQACKAKFTQHEAARQALVSTGTRPLTHRVRRDSRTIPGVIMADIWMRIRSQLQSEPIEDEAPPITA